MSTYETQSGAIFCDICYQLHVNLETYENSKCGKTLYGQRFILKYHFDKFTDALLAELLKPIHWISILSIKIFKRGEK
jgi:hypothetical protein